MSFFESNLANIWLLLIGFFLLYYAITDGAGLGIGIWSLTAKDGKTRRKMMGSIGHTWHASQTWLVILGGMLFGAFPLFYSIVLSALYIPILIMLIGLILRGVSFEFHERSSHESFWLYVFGFGSLIVTLAQGFALGGLLGGLDVMDSHFAGSVWSWATPYSALVAAGLFFGYLMLGANYLIARTTKDLQEKSYRFAWLAGLLTLLVTSAVHFLTGIHHPEMADKLRLSSGIYLPLLLVITSVCFIMYFRSLAKRQQIAPYFWNSIIIILSFTALSIGLYPNMIPGAGSSALTVQAVAASPLTLKFMLVMTAILLPVILAYTSYSYWIFRGKTDDNGYEEST
jgi:cytochrome d ubiquinol oxidase subunit II